MYYQYCLLIFHDGREEYLARTLESMEQRLVFDTEPYVILMCDGPTTAKFPSSYEVHVSERRLGVYASVVKAWDIVQHHAHKFDYIFHQENDFTYNMKIDVKYLREVLHASVAIRQVVLKRQPWSRIEKKRDNVIDAEAVKEYRIGNYLVTGQAVCFSFNPCLYPVSSIVLGDYPLTEKQIMRKLQGLSVYWGGINDLPLVTHIGEYSVKGKEV